MFRLRATRGLLQKARERSLDWHSQRGNEYDQALFPVDSEQEMTFEAIDLEELKSDKRNGIYFIFDETRNIGYVGMASSMTFGQRFYNGKEDCKQNCPPKCGCFGHINSTPDTCRSSRVITTDEEYRVYCLAEMDTTTAEVMQSEVDWYYILLGAEIDMVNAEWALGRAGYTGRPIVSCDIESATYYHFLTISEAASLLLPDHSGGAGAIGPMVSGYQNQLAGYTHRYATKEEIDIFRGTQKVSEVIRRFESNVEWVDKDANPVTDKNRNSRMSWVSGPLEKSDLDHLRKYAKGTYSKKDKSGFFGVYGFVDGKWRYSAKSDSWKAGGRKRIERLRYGFESARAAAIARELKIVKNGWQDFNKANFDWKPPKE